jgi:hypothetical protein
LATNLPPPCEVLGEVSLDAITPCPNGESSIATVTSFEKENSTSNIAFQYGNKLGYVGIKIRMGQCGSVNADLSMRFDKSFDNKVRNHHCIGYNDL